MLLVAFTVLIWGFDRWAGAEVAINQNSNSSTTTQMTPVEQTDLSGTYTGTFVCDEAGLSGDTTLTITGNQFTTADGKSGRIVATTTKGYTAVALQVGEMAKPTPGAAATAPVIISLRGRKNGNRLTLMSPPGSPKACTFTPTGSTAKSRRARGSRQAVTPPAATGTEVSNPTETTVPDTAGPTPPATPPTTKSRRGRAKANANANANANSNMNENSNSNTGTGNPNANSTPTPTPSPKPPQF
jgi:hypothetical protein